MPQSLLFCYKCGEFNQKWRPSDFREEENSQPREGYEFGGLIGGGGAQQSLSNPQKKKKIQDDLIIFSKITV